MPFEESSFSWRFPDAEKRWSAEITDAILAQITKGIVGEKHDCTPGQISYRLDNPDVKDIVKIRGIRGGSPQHEFRKGADYVLRGGMLHWLPDGEKPDDHSPFFVNYRIAGEPAITDINPGSVIRTIVESVAFELEFLYEQMGRVYRAGFVDSATGRSLELVVSLLGIERKDAANATGTVTFSRSSDPAAIPVQETHLFDVAQDRYDLYRSQVQSIRTVKGTAGGVQGSVFTPGEDYSLSDNVLVWQTGGRRPDYKTDFTVEYAAFDPIVVPIDTLVSASSGQAGSGKVFRTTQEATLKRLPSGAWEVDVPVAAISAGRDGNVSAHTGAEMPRPLPSIERVEIRQDITNGTDPEGDAELRARAKRALEAAGKATRVALQSSVENVKGVRKGGVMIEDPVDGVYGCVRVIADGGDADEIKRVIEATRAAGIHAEYKPADIVPVEIDMEFVHVEHLDPAELRDAIEQSVERYMWTVNIGDAILLSQIIRSALSVPGVLDVRNVKLNGDPRDVRIGRDQRGQLRALRMSALTMSREM